MKSKKFLATLALSMAVLGLVSCKTKNKNNTPENPGPVVTTKYTVTFVTNGGTNVNSIEVDAGSTVTLPTTTRDGYTFEGWYKDQAFNTAFTEGTTITANTTLYAKWVKNSEDPIVTPTTEYTVTFVTNGGTSVNPISVAENSTITSLPSTTRDGYSFTGWYTDASCSTLFDQTKPITKATTLYAGWTQETSGTIVTANGGYTEGLYAVFNETNAKSISIKVEYKLSTDTAYTRADNELVRATDTAGKARVDVIGLKAGNYDLKITNSNSVSEEIKNIQVTADDRSGYAHWNNTTGIGAYTNDGTLKSNAVVVYVTDDTKNTVTATIDGKTYTGLVNIIKACDANKNVPSADSMVSTPLDIRIIGSIQTQQWNSKTHGTGKTVARQTSLDTAFADVDWEATTANELLNPGMTASNNYYKIDEADIIAYGINSMSNDANNGITHLDGLTNNVLKDKSATTDSKDQGGASHYEYDSYYNELDVKYRENITVEGIGEDAQIYQWGFCFNQCNSVEVKNINFKDYTEDAVGIQGASDVTKYSDYWIHNCTFDSGKNNWDVCCENDKKEGDGSTDFKSAHDLTISYCRYNGTHKTALIGSGSSSYQYNVTFHHNYYNQCGSRLPFTRNTNFHVYNCYYYGSTGTNMQIQSKAYAFIEGCYFENTNKTFTTSDGGVIKLYNNTINSTSGVDASSTIVYATSRMQEVSNTCTADKVTDFSKFDTDENLFYYDSVNNISDVSLMLTSDTVKTYVPTVAGSGILAKIDYTKHSTEHNEAPVDTSTTATYTTTVPTSSGLYYTVTTDAGTTAEADLTSATLVKEDGGVITVTDTSDTATTTGYYIFDDAKKYTTGTHTYTINVSLQGVGSSWYFLRFLDNTGSEVLSVGTTKNTKHIGYTLDTSAISDAANEVDIASSAFVGNTTYTIVLTIDYDTNTATIKVGNDTQTISNFDIESLGGIKFFTAKKAADRSFTVNSITIE